MSEQSEPKLRVICMDCKTVTQEGDPGAPESHGLCERCFTLRMAELDRRGVAPLPSKEGHAA